MCPEGPSGPPRLQPPASPPPEEQEKKDTELPPSPSKDRLDLSQKDDVATKKPVICPCMLPLPEYMPPAEIIPIREEVGIIEPEDPLLCPAYYGHPCPAAAGTGKCPAHSTPRVGDICPTSQLEPVDVAMQKLEKKKVPEKALGRFISCNLEDETPADQKAPDVIEKPKVSKDIFAKVPKELQERYREHYKYCNLPARPDHPDWFPGYRCEWEGSHVHGFRTTQMDYGWYPPNVYTISHIYKPRLTEFTNEFGHFGPYFNLSLNI